MSTEHNEDPCIVLVNDEDQYSVWLARHAIPAGWRQVGSQGPRDQCVAFIEGAWTDMRPRSARPGDGVERSVP